MSIVKVLGTSLFLAISYLGIILAMEQGGKEVGATFQEASKDKNTSNEDQPKIWTLIEGHVTKSENTEGISYNARIKGKGLVNVFMRLKEPRKGLIIGTSWPLPKWNPEEGVFLPQEINHLPPYEEEECFYNLQDAFDKQEQSK
jgi:hypothetical protein